MFILNYIFQRIQPQSESSDDGIGLPNSKDEVKEGLGNPDVVNSTPEAVPEDNKENINTDKTQNLTINRWFE